VKRWSVEGKATVKIGAFSRGGQTRGDAQASDHDFGCDEKDPACGSVDEESAQLDLILGSSDQTSDLMVEALEAKWKGLEEQEQSEVSRLQLQMDTGPQSSGRRTQFLSRMVQFAEAIGKPIQLLYDPPSHSQSHPIERCGGLLERHWKGTKLIDAQTRLEWAKSMTWKGLHPVVELSRQVYQKGIKLSQKAMQAVEARLERDPKLPKYDILIQPASTA
jgi:hypothetical protein